MSDEDCNNVMVEIFQRLPPKYIIRFRSLSKFWHSLLVTPYFIRNHRLQCSKNPQKVIIMHPTSLHDVYRSDIIYTLHPRDQFPLDSPVFRFPYPRPSSFDRSPVVVGSCNGLLCLHSSKEISLWNFSIRRRLIVPCHPPLNLKSHADQLGFGFGFDATTNDYKIVAISYDTSFVYSLNSESWSVILSSSTRSFNPRSKACFLNGMLHWVIEESDNRSCFILTFNLSSHVFGHILWPDPLGIKHLITTINGCLAVVSWESEGDSGSWVMKEYGKTESLRFKLPTVKLKEAITALKPTRNGDILAYSVESKFYNHPMIDKLIKFEAGCFNVEIEPYVESLELADKESATTCGQTIVSRRNEVCLGYCRRGIVSTLCFEF